MKNTWYISLMLAVAAVVLWAPTTQAQVTATATVTLTVVAAPGQHEWDPHGLEDPIAIGEKCFFCHA